ncbi:MAG: hypothetical protein KAR40_16400 [Candidatus Sabulitectum sp.]|nr:hypothetical protein [Candidatus Sabulitectum sp.]
MVNLRVFTLIALLLTLISCTDITEHEMAFKAGLHIISSEDFSTIKTITDMVGARCLLIYPGNVFVASTEGTILRYDSESLELLEEYPVAAPSPAGFSDMVFSSLEGTAYLIGSLGIILEINLPDCTVLDEFSVCQSPMKLALGPGSEYLFVADGPSNKIYQVLIGNNKPYDSVSIYYTIKCMEPSQNPDSMLVGTSDGLCLIEILSPSTIRYVVWGLQKAYMALAAVPDDSIFVGVTRNSVGIFDLFVPLTEPPTPNFYGGVSIEGNTDFIAMGHDWQHAYVLSYLGDNTSRLVSYNYRFHTISQEVEIPGYPLDLEVSGNGVIYALTTE